MKDVQEKLVIISHSSEPFIDRKEAGRQVAEVLMKWQLSQPVVLGIPRGGLMVAQEVAKRLHADLDIVLTRKLGAPHQPELAIGAVTEENKVFIDENLADMVNAGTMYINREREKQFLEIQRRKDIYRQVKPKIPLRNRTVIIIDDGVATGSTLQAALWSVREEHPKQVIAALPVGPQKSLEELAKIADELVCLKVPRNLGGVGQFYIHFNQLTDGQVLDILKETL
jgi:predicted phosphoribosyltransferase